MGNNDLPWYQTPQVLGARPLEFFPTRDMTPSERLNGIVRFVLYAGVAVAAYRGDFVPLWIACVVVGVLSFVYSIPEDVKSSYPQHTKKDTTIRATCTPPSEANPFMNVLANEYGADKPPACAVTAETLDQSQAYFELGLPREISDVYRNRASDRQFVTMPVSGNNGTPDTLAFRNFLFSQLAKGPKCK
jgi:hypothetical protein